MRVRSGRKARATRVDTRLEREVLRVFSSWEQIVERAEALTAPPRIRCHLCGEPVGVTS